MKGLQLGFGAFSSIASGLPHLFTIPMKSDGSNPRVVHIAFLATDGNPIHNVTFFLGNAPNETLLTYEEPTLLYVGGSVTLGINNYAAGTINVWVTALDNY